VNDLAERRRAKKRWRRLLYNRCGDGSGGILESLGGSDRHDRCAGTDGQVHPHRQTFGRYGSVIAIAVVVPRIIDIIRQSGRDQTDADAKEKKNGQHSGPEARRPHAWIIRSLWVASNDPHMSGNHLMRPSPSFAPSGEAVAVQ